MPTKISTISPAQFPETATVEGYLWYSDQRKPEMVAGTLDLAAKLTKLPFVVEGMLYDEQNKTSYHILHLDGKNTIQQINLSDLSDVEYDEQIYFTRRVKSGEKYLMIEAWEETTQLIGSSEFTTLSPSWAAFKGFVK